MREVNKEITNFTTGIPSKLKTFQLIVFIGIFAIGYALYILFLLLLTSKADLELSSKVITSYSYSMFLSVLLRLGSERLLLRESSQIENFNRTFQIFLSKHILFLIIRYVIALIFIPILFQRFITNDFFLIWLFSLLYSISFIFAQVLRGLDKKTLSAAAQNIFHITPAITYIIFYSDLDFHLIFYYLIIGSFISLIISLIGFKTKTSDVGITISNHKSKGIISYSLISISVFFYNGMDILILSNLGMDHHIPYYAISSRIAMSIGFIYIILNSLTSRAVSKYGDLLSVQSILSKHLHLSFSACVLYILGFISIFNVFIVFGVNLIPQQEIIMIIVSILLIGQIIDSLSSAISITFQYIGYEAFISFINLNTLFFGIIFVSLVGYFGNIIYFSFSLVFVRFIQFICIYIYSIKKISMHLLDRTFLFVLLLLFVQLFLINFHHNGVTSFFIFLSTLTTIKVLFILNRNIDFKEYFISV